MKKRKIGRRFLHYSNRFLRKLIQGTVLMLGGCLWLIKYNEERTQAQARREAQNRMNEFISIASHELKTPLTSIKGNVQLIGRRLKNTEENQPDETKRLLSEARVLLEKTDQQITRLARMVNGLLEASRINGNTMDLLFELCELDPLLQEVLHNSKHISQLRELHVQSPEDTTLVVMADPTRIKQVIVHFLSNAHKFSPLEKPIEIKMSKEDHTVRVEIVDQGQGIASEEQKRIWERYYRIPGVEVLNGSEVGLGLGLHISRTIIHQHHGQIGLQSTPGAGANFWFTLPLAEVPA